MASFTVTTEGFLPDGSSIAHLDGREFHVFGALPGEEVTVREISRKKGVVIAIVESVEQLSPLRIDRREEHYLSCSPWQILTPLAEAEEKKHILERQFSSRGIAVPPIDFVPSNALYGYRTKMEYSFADRDAPLSLAFHERGGSNHRLRLKNGCDLGSVGMNAIALAVVDLLRSLDITATQLKTIVVRESKSTGAHLALLYVKDPTFPAVRVLEGILKLSVPTLSGIRIFHSDKRSPASVPTALLAEWGSDTLVDHVAGIAIEYSWDAFFQNNIPMFTEALTRMREAIPPHTHKVVELYSGAGTIGLALADLSEEVYGIEIIPSAAENANVNARRNHINNYTAESVSAEEITGSLLDDTDVLVLDPPRAGLHPKVITMILTKRPRTILYLACDPGTQARDIKVLEAQYRITSVTGYDFYPRTPHMESLAVLRLRGEDPVL